MSISIYLDESAYDKRLVRVLMEAGHAVRTPVDSGLLEESDDEKHLAYAAHESLVLLTKNPEDFRQLHEKWKRRKQSHRGILLIYQENNAQRDMKPHDVVRAIGNLAQSQLDLSDQLINLNSYRGRALQS